MQALSEFPSLGVAAILSYYTETCVSECYLACNRRFPPAIASEQPRPGRAMQHSIPALYSEHNITRTTTGTSTRDMRPTEKEGHRLRAFRQSIQRKTTREPAPT